MKNVFILILVVLSVVLSGCTSNPSTKPKHVEAADYICQNNGGYTYFVIENWSDDMSIRCFDGSYFEIYAKVDNTHVPKGCNNKTIIDDITEILNQGE